MWVNPAHELDLVRTIRDTGERERGAHRDTEGGWAGFTLTTGSQGFLREIYEPPVFFILDKSLPRN